MAGSVLVVVAAVDRIANLRSLETRQGIETFLLQPPISGSGLDVEAVTRILHVSGLVAAACATAAAILGWYVLKPSRSARLGLSVVAVPLFVAGLAVGGFAASFVAAAAAMLWVSPGREWFATGRWTPPRPAPKTAPAARPWSAPPGSTSDRPDLDRPGGDGQGSARPDVDRPDSDPPTSGLPPADRPPSDRPDLPGPYRPAPHQPNPWAIPAAGRHPAPGSRGTVRHQRPGALVVAFVLTVVTSAVALVLAVLATVVVGLSPDLVMEEAQRQRPELLDQGLTLAQLRFSTYVSAAAVVLWCATAIAFASFAMARRAWARRGLMITAAGSAGACIVLALTAPVVLVPAVAGVATVVCLRREDVRLWFARGRD